jgi:phage terminase large subunit
MATEDVKREGGPSLLLIPPQTQTCKAVAEITKKEGYTAIYRAIRDDPFALCRLLKFEPTDQQCQLLRDVAAGYRRVACRSGQGTGKSRLAALIALWRVLRAPGARVIVTAPSMRQCQDVIMQELRILMTHAPQFLKELLNFTTRKVAVGKRMKDDDDRPDWGILCVTASDPRNAQGYHGDQLTFIVDEASGVPRAIIEQIEGTLGQITGDFLHLQIGNPNTADCAFYDCWHTKRRFWKSHTFNAEESPLVSPEHCAYLRESYGEESDTYRVRVLGQFPSMEPNAVLNIDDLEACTKTSMVDMAMLQGRKQFGIDLARFGSDESVIYRKQGRAVVEWKIFAKKEPGDVVAYAFGLQTDAGWRDGDCYYVPDAGGMGQGVMLMFKQASKRYLEFHTQGTPRDSRQFYDRMTEAWWCFRKLCKARLAHIPNDPVLLEQLSTRLYVLKDGKFKIESKDDYKKRTEKSSPDRADALVMAFYEPPGEVKLAGVD